MATTPASSSRCALLLGVCALALAPCAASAQQSAAQAGPARDGTNLDDITVTSTRRAERAVDAMAGVSVTTRRALQREQPQRIGAEIARMPGVTTQENPNDPATAINIRGLQDFGRVAVTVDGARQNFQRSGHNANGAFFLDPAFVRSIDVTRGPVANVYGSGAIGGVASFETIRPSDILRGDERAAAEVAGTGLAARQGGWNGSIVGALRPVDWASALAGFSFRDTGEYRNGAGVRVRDSGQELRSGIGKIELKPGEGHTLAVSGQLQKYEFTAGAGTATDIRRANEVETDSIAARYTFARPDISWLNLSASAYSTGTQTNQRRVSGTPAQIGQRRFFRIRTEGFDINNTARFDIAPQTTLALTAGVDGFRDRVRTNDVFGNGDETTPSGERAVYGGFLQSQLTWRAFDLIAAGRYDAYRLEGGRTKSQGSRVSPKLTLGWRATDWLQVYGTYAEGYRAPAITETLVDGLHPAPASFTFVPNPNLRPEVGRTLEAGVNIRKDDLWREGDRLRAKLSVFRNDVRDFIDGAYVDPRGMCGAPFPNACRGAYYTYRNVSQARLTGVEGELIYDARRWLAGLSGSIVRGDDRTKGQPLQSVYPDKLAVNAGVRFFDERLEILGRMTFVAAQKRLPASARATASKAYTLIDLSASYAVTKDARAFVSLENIGDVRYRRFRDGADSPGFVAKFGFTSRLGV